MTPDYTMMYPPHEIQSNEQYVDVESLAQQRQQHSATIYGTALPKELPKNEVRIPIQLPITAWKLTEV